MQYRLILDENIEHEVARRLEAAGHDVEHVDDVPALGKGTTDEVLSEYSLQTDRTIVTYDDDFIRRVPADAYRAVLFIEDQMSSAESVAKIIHAMSAVYSHAQVAGLQKIGREWL